MVAKKGTRRVDKSAKRTAKTAGSDGRKTASCMVGENFSMIVLLSIKNEAGKPEIKIGRQQGRHCRMPTLIQSTAASVLFCLSYLF